MGIKFGSVIPECAIKFLEVMPEEPRTSASVVTK
jgi:hypothetical protein